MTNRKYNASINQLNCRGKFMKNTLGTVYGE